MYSFAMPIYDFECRKCGKTFEELVRLGETPACPECGAADPERLFSASAGISTTTTRERSASVARRKARGIKREKDHAQREYERNYIKDHS
jgi:putative FmdB family regulatory protein